MDSVGTVVEAPWLYDFQSLTREFRMGGGSVVAVDAIDLQVAPGEFVVIEGPSGSGKSTLLQLLGALDKPTSGTMLFNGRDLGGFGDSELTALRASEIGFVFQQFNLIPTLTAAENVEAAMVTGELSKPERRARVAELLASVGLGERAGHLPSKLSGGEQQRVAIARALANGPRVILADEPTGNLDSRTAEEVVSILSGLCDEGVTVIIVTHSEEVARYAQRRLRMRDGKLHADWYD